jgi:hypothetical protein
MINKVQNIYKKFRHNSGRNGHKTERNGAKRKKFVKQIERTRDPHGLNRVDLGSTRFKPCGPLDLRNSMRN